MVHDFNHFHQEEGIFAYQVVVFEIHDNILAACVSDHVAKASCGALDIRRRILGAADVYPNAGATDLHSDVYELFRMGNRPFASIEITVVEAVVAIDSNVHGFGIGGA